MCLKLVRVLVVYLPHADFGVLTEVDNSSALELFNFHRIPILAIPFEWSDFVIGGLRVVWEETEAKKDSCGEASVKLGSAQLSRC